MLLIPAWVESVLASMTPAVMKVAGGNEPKIAGRHWSSGKILTYLGWDASVFIAKDFGAVTLEKH